jgi:hypothetical protein
MGVVGNALNGHGRYDVAVGMQYAIPDGMTMTTKAPS